LNGSAKASGLINVGDELKAVHGVQVQPVCVKRLLPPVRVKRLLPPWRRVGTVGRCAGGGKGKAAIRPCASGIRASVLQGATRASALTVRARLGTA